MKNSYELLDEELDNLILSNFSQHPFSNIPHDTNYEQLLANYLAMSQAFPFLQA